MSVLQSVFWQLIRKPDQAFHRRGQIRLPSRSKGRGHPRFRRETIRSK